LSEIGRYYPADFYDVSATPERLLEDKKASLNAKVTLVGKQAPGRLLDVGCQKGEFLHVMKQRGWDVQGVEFSSAPPNLFGVPIVVGRLEDAPFPPGSFDLITLWAVLEHVHDPLIVLRHVRRLLKPTGRTLVLVPNFNSIPGRFLRHDDVPRHLLMFTKRTLRMAAERVGLHVNRLVFADDVFSGSTRGVLNYLWKLSHGECLDGIVAQNRSPGRWGEFANELRGKPNRGMLAIDRLDIRLTPYLDRFVSLLGLGFIMTADLSRAEKGALM